MAKARTTRRNPNWSRINRGKRGYGPTGKLFHQNVPPPRYSSLPDPNKSPEAGTDGALKHLDKFLGTYLAGTNSGAARSRVQAAVGVRAREVMDGEHGDVGAFVTGFVAYTVGGFGTLVFDPGSAGAFVSAIGGGEVQGETELMTFGPYYIPVGPSLSDMQVDPWSNR